MEEETYAYLATQGQVFVDPGATASDVQDGDLTAAIEAESTVNMPLPGTCAVTYTVSDSAGHTVTAVRSVIVISRPSTDGGTGAGGGGGSLDAPAVALLLLLALMIARRGRTIRGRVGP